MASVSGGNDVVISMIILLFTLLAIVISLISLQTPIVTNDVKRSSSRYFPCPKEQPSKYAYEMYCAYYSIVWMTVFGCIVVFQWYEAWTEAWIYNSVLGVLALPLILQPFLVPSAFQSANVPDVNRPWMERYSTKANLWMVVYSFIGNYWYTHYFYSVLGASYSMPSTRVNNVPIAMFFATIFYFSSYHVFSNCCLRKIKTTYAPGFLRTTLYVTFVLSISYFTAFMETLTISSFPYYSFEDRDMAYTVGSAFYGIYFIVSFPAFSNFDEDIDNKQQNAKIVSLWGAFESSCGYGMMILCLLDFVRLFLGIPLVI